MAHYSPRGFLRQASNPLLQQYFESKRFDLKLDWSSVEETKIEPVWAAWQALPAQQREATDALTLPMSAGWRLRQGLMC